MWHTKNKNVVPFLKLKNYNYLTWNYKITKVDLAHFVLLFLDIAKN